MTKPINKTVKYFSYIIFAFLATFIIGISSAKAWEVCYYGRVINNLMSGTQKDYAVVTENYYALFNSGEWTKHREKFLTMRSDMTYDEFVKYINDSNVYISYEDLKTNGTMSLDHCPPWAFYNPPDTKILGVQLGKTEFKLFQFDNPPGGEWSMDRVYYASWSLGLDYQHIKNWSTIDRTWTYHGSKSLSDTVPSSSSEFTREASYAMYHLQYSDTKPKITEAINKMESFSCDESRDKCMDEAGKLLTDENIKNIYGICKKGGTLEKSGSLFNPNTTTAQRTEMLQLCAQMSDMYDKLNSGIIFEGCDFFSKALKDFLMTLYYFLAIAGLVLTIVLGIMDFVKAAASHEGDANKKAGSKFVKRIIAAALLLLLPTLINFTLSISGYDWVPEDSTCLPFKE